MFRKLGRADALLLGATPSWGAARGTRGLARLSAMSARSCQCADQGNPISLPNTPYCFLNSAECPLRACQGRIPYQLSKAEIPVYHGGFFVMSNNYHRIRIQQQG